jgi:two-component system alkaline phosphatase synthesis response regulator PhoP
VKSLPEVLQKQVFVIEDDVELRALLQITIEALGIGVRTFPEVTEFLRERNALCDLYVIDLHLPGISGLVFCRELKSDERTKNIPVIVISGNPNIGRLATKAYANDYLLKPFNQTMITEKIQLYIS